MGSWPIRVGGVVMAREWIHTPYDGRSRARKVVVNGVEIERVFYADTRRGICRYYQYPLKLHRDGKRAISRTLRGAVEVIEDGS